MNKLPKIHFILPGGGVRGAFQAGFLYKLRKIYGINLKLLVLMAHQLVQLMDLL